MTLDWNHFTPFIDPGAMATIIADADFLNLGGATGLDGPVGDNLDALLAELNALRAGN